MKLLLNQLFIVLTSTSPNIAPARAWIQSYYTPFLTLLLFVIPLAGVISSLVVIVKWLGLSEDEQERKKPGATIKKIVFWCLIGEGITTIFTIFGLVNG